MEAVISPLPNDVVALKALLAAALQRADEADARAANAQARESAVEAMIAHLKLQIAKLRREQYGPSAERSRQAERFAREGVPLSVSTLADQVGAAASALMPLYRRIEVHVLAAERLHGDNTTVPVMAKLKTDIARLLGLCTR